MFQMVLSLSDELYRQILTINRGNIQAVAHAPHPSLTNENIAHKQTNSSFMIDFKR